MTQCGRDGLAKDLSQPASVCEDRPGPHACKGALRAPKLDFGPWQQVYYADFVGQRRKRVVIKIIGE
jgi:hypothetical protein